MELTGLGGGVMLALAAVLWLLYLLPSWLKRGEYMATERKAMRALAESGEAARTVRIEQLAQRPVVGPVAVGRPITPVYKRPDAAATAARRRRTRALASLVLLAAVIVTVVQLVLMFTTGVVGGAWLVLGSTSLVGLVSFATLSRLADYSRTHSVAAPAQRRRSQPLVDHEFAVAPARQDPWTPVAVPKPLYLSRATIMQAADKKDPIHELAQAASAAERALRSVQQPPSIGGPAEPMPGFAAMGIIDDSRPAAPDLDAALARRRAAG